jgi:hypothetical protein
MTTFELLNFRGTDRIYCELRTGWTCKAKVTLLILPYYVLGSTENDSWCLVSEVSSVARD